MMKSQNQQSPSQPKKSDNKNQKTQQVMNKNSLSVLPPGIEEAASYGHLFIEIGNLEWLQYDGQNYLESGGNLGSQTAGSSSEASKGVNSLFCNIKFWGDQKGVFLKFANGIKKREQAINKFKYDIKAPEKMFERYLDDMKVLVVEFYDTDKNLTIGVSKIILSLYLKRAKSINDDSPLLELRGKFPITSRANDSLKIGEFSISIISSFNDPFNPKGLQPREDINLEDSFIQNEKIAQQMTQENKNKNIIEKAFSDDRIPSSLVNRMNSGTYKKETFEGENIDQRTRQQKQQQQENQRRIGKENQRNLINIDEGEDTFHNQQEFERIFSRGENLRKQMNDALDQDKAWETIHGQNILPKRYVPPFLQQEEEKKKQRILNDDELDNIYAIEIEGTTSDNKNNQNQDVSQDFKIQSENNTSIQLKDMKFIMVKIKELRIDNEELLHSLIDSTFNLIVELPLPDIYQKKITHQQLKLNNYDVISFNEFSYNSMTLYNFKIDEETFNQLISAQIKVSIEGKQTTGTLNMNRVLLANDYKLIATIPLERKIQVEEKKVPSKSIAKQQIGTKKDPKANKAQVKEAVKPQEYSKQVGTIKLEINLQRGDTEQELARHFQLKIKAMEDQKQQEDLQRQKQTDKRMKFSQQQDPVFAQLYLNIDQIRNLCLAQDGTIQNPQLQAVTSFIKNETFNQRQSAFSIEQADENKQTLSPVAQKRNLYVQYKSFPTLDKLKTNIIYHEKDPKFGYRTQFPLIMSPELLEKLEKFTFILEVWDQISPAKEEFIGLVKIPLASFCYSMKTSDEEVFSLNFLADQHCVYPMIVADDFLPIYSPRLGANVGDLKITLALGTPLQINRQIQKEQEQEKTIMQVTFQQQIEMTLKSKFELEKNEFQRKQIDEEEIRRKILQEQEELKEQNKIEPERSATPERLNQDSLFGTNNLMQQNINNFLRQSLNLQQSKGDLDIRKMTFINCIRKLFEEARSADIQEINSDEIFKDVSKNFDGSVKKDDFIYSILNRQEFSLTRTELSNICQIMLNINRDDNNNINVDELQMSYRSYLKYYEIIEKLVVDLLEKFRLNILKKFENQDQLEEFTQQIEQNSQESKLQLTDFKHLLESNGIIIREALFDQFSVYFDLDRNGSVYIQSFCDYMRNSTMNNFNFFKVNPIVLTNQISEFVKNAIESDKDAIDILEKEFKIEIFKIKTKNENPNENDIGDEFLLNERINAKLFQFKLKKQGIVLSLWEVFQIFEHLNIQYAKMFYEPQRYHYINFGLFFRFITNEDYDQKVQKIIQEKNNFVKASMDSVFGLAQEINQKKKKGDGSSEEGLYSDSNQESEQEEVIISKKQKNKKHIDITFDNKKKSKNEEKKQERKDTSEVELEDESVKLTDKSIQMEEQLNPDDLQRKLNRPYRNVKHIFEIKVKELINIPLLGKLIKDQTLNSGALTKSPTISQKQQKSPRGPQNKYIQNAAVKYAFPLDDDELLGSDYLQQNLESLQDKNEYSYVVSMNTTHTYILKKEDKIVDLFQKIIEQTTNQTNQIQSGFNISVVLYEDRQEFVIGNAPMPLEDLIHFIQGYEQNNQLDQFAQDKKHYLNRILYIYGTTFSQRENCIIGKINIEISYSTENQYINQDDIHREKSFDIANQQSFLHRETLVNRKIPLNAVLSVYIERISNLKESIGNIEHFAKIQTNSFNEMQDNMPKTSKQTTLTGASGKTATYQNKDQTDRRRILTQIYRDGLNLTVIASVFEEDQDLKKKFPGSKYQTRMLYNTLNPVFSEQFEQNILMDENIFSYLKNKRATFEVRHYITQGQQDQRFLPSNLMSKSQSQEKLDSNRSAFTEDDKDIYEKCDYIVIGYVKVPLLSLFQSNNGIEGEFQILDDYKQQMGSIKLRIALNHFDSSRPLYSGTNKLQKQNIEKIQSSTIMDKTMNISSSLVRGKPLNLNDHQFIIGINFIELITKNRKLLLNQDQLVNQQSLLYLKFKFQGSNHQTKFLSENSQHSEFMKKLQMKVFDIRRTIFLNIDLSKQSEVEEAFSKPLEIQLWFKRDNVVKYKQPEQEVQVGSFFVELNEISKYRNRRVKDSDGNFYSYEGYLSLYDFEKEQVTQDRLGVKLYYIKQEYEQHLQDLEVLFHNMKQIDQEIVQNYDNSGKGYIEVDDLKQIVEQNLKDPYRYQMQRLIENLDYKNADQVYYSTLFGLPQPYFRDRYTKRFDQFGIIEKINKELQALDNHDNGFVPVGLFKSILDHELKMKNKIVEDFIFNLRDGELQKYKTLDVNVQTHNFKNDIDYVTLLRKLIFYFEIRSFDKSTSENLLLTGQRDFMSEIENEMSIKIQIDCAIRLKNPISDLEAPNSFVRIRLPFRNCTPQEIETPLIQRNSYPTWQFQSQGIKVPLSPENIKIMMTQGLEFEVYHTKLGQNDKLNSILIGIAFVDLSLFAFVDNQYQISGHFHIMQKGDYQSIDKLTTVNPMRISSESLGQLKLSVITNTNVQRVITQGNNLQTQTLKQQFSPLKQTDQNIFNQYGTQIQEFNPFQQILNNQSFARQTNQFDDTMKSQQEQQLFHLMSQTHQKLESSFKEFGLSLNQEHDIDKKHNQNMMELDQLNQKMLNSLKVPKSADQQKEEVKYNQDFAQTRGYRQSTTLYEQIKGIDSQANLQRVGTFQNQVFEVLEEGSELDREENVFENNISESSEQKNQQNQVQQIQDQFKQIHQFNPNNQQEQQFIQTFNRKNTPIFSQTNQQQQKVENDSFKEEESQQNSFLGEDSFRQSQSNNIFEMQNLNRFQEVQEEIKANEMISRSEDKVKEREFANTETKKVKGSFKITDDDDDFDEVEMARLQKILKSQKK